MKKILIIAGIFLLTYSCKNDKSKDLEQAEDDLAGFEDFDEAEEEALQNQTTELLGGEEYSEPSIEEAKKQGQEEEKKRIEEITNANHVSSKPEPEIQPVSVQKQDISEKTQINSSSSGLYPQTSERKLTKDELIGLSPKDLRIMRNEIYARHGYIFDSKSLKNYFESQGWYVPTSKDVKLTSIETYNIDIIKSVE